MGEQSIVECKAVVIKRAPVTWPALAIIGGLRPGRIVGPESTYLIRKERD